jgi:hypothetical protein
MKDKTKLPRNKRPLSYNLIPFLREWKYIVRNVNKSRFQISPLDDKSAPVGPLEGGAKWEEGNQIGFKKKAQTFRLP